MIILDSIFVHLCAPSELEPGFEQHDDRAVGVLRVLGGNRAEYSGFDIQLVDWGEYNSTGRVFGSDNLCEFRDSGSGDQRIHFQSREWGV